MTMHPNHGHFRCLAAAVTPSAGRPTTPLHAYSTARASAAGDSPGGGMEAAGMDVGRRRCTCTLTTTPTTTGSSAPGDRDGFRPAADDPDLRRPAEGPDGGVEAAGMDDMHRRNF